MIGRLWLNKCQIGHWRASSLLFMPNGCNVLALFIREASRAFLTESRLLCMSSIGMRRTSLIEWPAWLKWYWSGCAELLVIQDRASVFPKAFTELMKVSVMCSFKNWYLIVMKKNSSHAHKQDLDISYLESFQNFPWAPLSLLCGSSLGEGVLTGISHHLTAWICFDQ